MKKILYILLGFGLTLAGTVFALNVSVPAGNGSGFLLQSLSTGNYATASLTAGSNVTISTTTSNITISSTGGGGTGTVSTSSSETNTYIPFWTSTNGTPALLSGGTSNLTWNGTKLFASQASTTQLSAGFGYFGTTATSTFGSDGSLTLHGTLTNLGTATSSFAGGINLTSGCLSINSTCVGGSSGSGTISTSTPLVSGQVDFSTSASTIGNDSQFYWDSTNHELGVGGTPGSAKLYVNGNVGIGTTSPGSSLTIIGPNSATFPLQVGSQWNSSTNELVVDNNGHVGINKSNPITALDVNGIETIEGSGNYLNFSNSGAGNRITMNNPGPTNSMAIAVDGNGSNSWMNLGYTANPGTAATPVLTVKDTGNVGIGTTSPDSKLDVNGSVRLEGTSSFVTSAIGGAIVSGGCDSVTTTGLDATISSTTAFVTTPQGDPGSTLGGTWAYSFVSTPGSVITRVCSNVTVTPNSVPYVVKILK